MNFIAYPIFSSLFSYLLGNKYKYMLKRGRKSYYFFKNGKRYFIRNKSVIAQNKPQPSLRIGKYSFKLTRSGSHWVFYYNKRTYRLLR